MTASRGVVRDYLALTKPRIVVLLLLTALGGMFLASGGVPEMSLVLLVLGAGALAGGGAQALNHSLERDIDAVMWRTRGRPVASGRVSPRRAMVFGALLNAVAFVILAVLVNPLSALITLTGALFYVFVYTMVLKRSTPQNIVIGGAAGAVPPMVGWAAVTGQLELPAVYLFAIVFFWTPPHFWALSLLLKDDYARAGVPMLPVVTSVWQTKWHILLYTLLLFALTLMFFTTQAVGLVYLVAASTLGALFLLFGYCLLRGPGIRGARTLYLYSLLYIALLFVAVGIDSMVGV